MKLRTEMRGKDGAKYVIGTPGNNAHDLLAAHALMMAIGEFYAAPLDSALITPEDAINWLEWRASEIMAGWGFDTGEIDPPTDRRIPEVE